jgi:hypothetical protein
MALSDYFLNNFETSDNPKDKRLSTHYYTNDLERTTTLIKKAVESTCFVLTNEDTTYNELLLEFKNIRIVVTLFRVSLYETRVDMIVNTNYVLPFKRGIKIIDDLYKEFDKVLTLKYKGGYNG